MQGVPEGDPGGEEDRAGRGQGHFTEGPQAESNYTLGAVLILSNDQSRKHEVGVQRDNWNELKLCLPCFSLCLRALKGKDSSQCFPKKIRGSLFSE